jgi:hypothetical protein
VLEALDESLEALGRALDARCRGFRTYGRCLGSRRSGFRALAGVAARAPRG